eukprot:7482013-Pyramimonas_sp.AAC.2
MAPISNNLGKVTLLLNNCKGQPVRVFGLRSSEILILATATVAVNLITAFSMVAYASCFTTAQGMQWLKNPTIYFIFECSGNTTEQ